MVESYLGAVFVDSEFNFEVIEIFFNKHIKPFFHDMSIYDTFANKHPTVRYPPIYIAVAVFWILNSDSPIYRRTCTTDLRMNMDVLTTASKPANSLESMEPQPVSLLL